MEKPSSRHRKYNSSLTFFISLMIFFSCGDSRNSYDSDYNKHGQVKLVKYYVVVENMPEFLGGELKLRKFIQDAINYPVDALNQNIKGKVFVTFVGEKDSHISSAKIARGVNPLLDNEALRVIYSLPKWTPGNQNGKPVRVSYTVPVNFEIK